MVYFKDVQLSGDLDYDLVDVVVWRRLNGSKGRRFVQHEGTGVWWKSGRLLQKFANMKAVVFCRIAKKVLDGSSGFDGMKRLSGCYDGRILFSRWLW